MLRVSPATPSATAGDRTSGERIDADVALAGGGLAAGLIALALRRARPELRVVAAERAPTLGAGHTWSFFGSDLSAAAQALAAPMIAHSWPGYAVRFPRHARRLGSPYHSVSDTAFDAHVRASVPAGDLLTGAEIAAVAPDRITLADGRVVTARTVIDCRGAAGDTALAHLELGWQKFVGVELECAEPHGLAEPVIMDATVPQADGYRFLYALPFTPTRVLVEDTRYADGHVLNRADVAAEARAYAVSQGWREARVVREEHGVLPIALAGDIEGFWREADRGGVARAGLRAALFHPTTGYSLPDAAHTALAVAALPELTTASVAACVRARSIAAWEDRGFFRLLDRMLFRAAAPHERYRVLERFYRLPAPLIARFYAARLTQADKLRTLTGWPPVPIGRALACMSERPVLRPAA